MFLIGQVSGLVKNLNIWIFSDIINVINDILCMRVLHIELYRFLLLLLLFLTTFSDLNIISQSQHRQTVFTENFMFLSDQVKTL